MNIYIQLFDERLLVPRVYILEPEKCGFACIYTIVENKGTVV